MWQRDVLLAAALTLAGELEVVLGSAGGDAPLVSALLLPGITLPLAFGRRAPVASLWVLAVVLAVQAVPGGGLAGAAVTTVVALALALYWAGRYAGQLAGATAAAVAVCATRIAADPAAQSPRDAALTLAAVACPLLLGRWARGQGLLQRELAARAQRRARDRARDTHHAAEQERARIAADLQVAVAAGLRAIIAGADEPDRDGLARIAATARAALADVRRILGVLRKAGEAAPLAPGRAEPPEPLPARAPAPAAALARRRVPGPLADRLLAALVALAGLIELALTQPAAIPTAFVIAAPLLWRRRAPVLAAAGVLAAITLQSVLLDRGSFPLGDVLAMCVATYAIGAYAGRRDAIAGLLLIGAGSALHAAVFYPDGVAAALLGGVVLPWTVGRLVHGHRALTAAERRRNAEIERSRAADARAAVTRERLRVARELHDAVAHNLSVIAIQADGAAGILERDATRAGECVTLIAAVAREALTELGRLAGPAGDGPSLTTVSQLAERARSAGVPVELRVDGRPAALPAGLDLAAFRLVQEALANTGKHARAGHAWVSVRYGARALELEIADDGRGPNGGASGGHGLVGMRERVALYGGTFDAGARPGGGFRVRARLPL